jgi:hypothetical protein
MRPERHWAEWSIRASRRFAIGGRCGRRSNPGCRARCRLDRRSVGRDHWRWNLRLHRRVRSVAGASLLHPGSGEVLDDLLGDQGVLQIGRGTVEVQIADDEILAVDVHAEQAGEP